MSVGHLDLPTPMDQEQRGVALVLEDIGTTTTTRTTSEAEERGHMSTDSGMVTSTVTQLENSTDQVAQPDEAAGEPKCSDEIRLDVHQGTRGGGDTGEKEAKESGRERLKRHRREMGGRVWIPEIWGKEELLDDWSDCLKFDKSLFPKGLLSAREALVKECSRRANSGGVRRAIRNPCS